MIYWERIFVVHLVAREQNQRKQQKSRGLRTFNVSPAFEVHDRPALLCLFPLVGAGSVADVQRPLLEFPLEFLGN